jgi:hypothetical protein
MAAQERDDAPTGVGPAISLGERLASLERIVTRQREELLAQSGELAAQRERADRQEALITRLRVGRAERPAAAASRILPANVRGRGTAGADAAPPARANGRRASRRALLRLGGAAAAAAAAAGTAMALGNTQEAHAATGGLFILGQTNDAGATTTLTATMGTAPAIGLAVDNITINSGTGGIGIRGQGGSNGVGVLGHALGTQGSGVYGITDTGFGVVGNAGSGIDLAGNGTGRFFLHLQSFTGAPTGSGTTYQAGELIRDHAGDVWICVAGGAPGQWRKLSAPQVGYAGGALNLLPVPIRLLDTRAGAPVGFARPGAPIGYHATLQMQAAGIVDFQGQTIPAGATAVFGNLVVALAPGVDPGDGSSLICWPNGQARPAAVNLVYNGGDLKSEYTSTFTLVAIGTSNLVDIYSQPINDGVAVDVIFDAFGFVM